MMGPKWVDEVFSTAGKVVAVVVIVAILIGVVIGMAA